MKEKGFYVLPSHLFINIRKKAREDANLNETLSKLRSNGRLFLAYAKGLTWYADPSISSNHDITIGMPVTAET